MLTSTIFSVASHLAAVFKTARHGHFVGEFKIAANRNAHGDPRNARAEWFQQSRKINRCCLPFHGRIRGNDHFLHVAFMKTVYQSFDAQLLRTNAAQRRNGAMQHVIQAMERTRGFNRNNIVRFFHNAD